MSRTQHQKLALIVESKVPHWKSCQQIQKNLRKSYAAMARAEIRVFKAQGAHLNDYVLIAQSVADYAPDAIVMLDHAVNTFSLIQKLPAVMKNPPPLYVHVQGDFLHAWPYMWLQLNKKFKNVHFLCASRKHKLLVEKLIVGGSSAVSVCPFPCDSEKFRFSQARRNLLRKNLALKRTDKLVLYAGRLSLQKNILRLTAEMASAIEKDSRIYFYIIGEFDNRGATPFGLTLPKNFYQKEWYKFVRALPLEIQKRIRHIPQMDHKALADFYCASDVYISLSTHHDEDFGMAPLEAAYCGLPLVLTHWGGYAEYKDQFKAVELVPLRLTVHGYKMSSGHIQSALRKALKCSRRKTKYASIQLVSKQLQKILTKKHDRFLGFSKLMHKYSAAYIQQMNGRPLYKGGPSSRGFYREIYADYYGNSK